MSASSQSSIYCFHQPNPSSNLGTFYFGQRAHLVEQVILCLVLAQGIGVFLKLYSHRLGIKRTGWERKSLLELSFNLVGDSRKEHTDKILAHLDFFHTVKYWKKIQQM